MPLYQYRCDQCGTFEAQASVDRYRQPAVCPGCGAQAPRVPVSLPRLALMDGASRIANTVNERSADAPRKSSHGPGCSCCGGARQMPSGTLRRPDGSKSFPGKRPWMISH